MISRVINYELLPVELVHVKPNLLILAWYLVYPAVQTDVRATASPITYACIQTTTIVSFNLSRLRHDDMDVDADRSRTVPTRRVDWPVRDGMASGSDFGDE